jgi:hypothetical protein
MYHSNFMITGLYHHIARDCYWGSVCDYIAVPYRHIAYLGDVLIRRLTMYPTCARGLDMSHASVYLSSWVC